MTVTVTVTVAVAVKLRSLHDELYGESIGLDGLDGTELNWIGLKER